MESVQPGTTCRQGLDFAECTYVILWSRDFVLYILPLGLVRPRTFRLSAWVSLVQTWAQMLTRAQEDVSFIDVKIKIPHRKVDQWMWMTSCTGSACGGFGGFWKSQLSWVPASEEEGWLSLARRGLVSGSHVVWGRWKSQVYLSPYVEKPLNSKVTKKFRTWTKKSLRVFRVSGFLCSMYICYEHSMYVSHIHVWLCYTHCRGEDPHQKRGG